MHPLPAPPPSALALEPCPLSDTQAREGFLAAEKWPSMSPGPSHPPQQAPDSETGQLPPGCPPLPFPGLEGRVGRRVSSLLSWGFGLDPLPFTPGSQRNQCAPM